MMTIGLTSLIILKQKSIGRNINKILRSMSFWLRVSYTPLQQFSFRRSTSMPFSQIAVNVDIAITRNVLLVL